MPMRTLVAKIEASAAERLVLPPGRKPTEELQRYKNFLKVETHRLRILHRGGATGREVCRARAAILDVLLRYILEGVRQSNSELSEKMIPPLALVAIGGYGRGELNPNSDIDFMFLHTGEYVHAGKPKPQLTALIDGLLYPLWDIGLKVGHSVRSIADCIHVANTDMQSKTSLIEARVITGNHELFKVFEKQLLDKCISGHEDEYIDERVKDQATRHSKFGNSATMQEPNIKNGCGGLRDYQNLIWMAYFKYRTRTMEELHQRGMVSAAEARQLDAAYDYLLRTRNELHYATGRPLDVLGKSIQPTVAHGLGYTERSPSKRIESFMRDFYTHTRNIYLITRTVEQRLALLPQPKLLPDFRKMFRDRFGKKEQIVDGFKIADGQIHAVTNHVFREQPRRLMRVFLHSQQRGLKLHPDLSQLIRHELALVDRAFLKDEHVRETFLEILNQRGNVAPIVRAMHEVGLLGKYMPEFGKLTCLVQHEFYHQYTADEHTLVCLEKLDQVWEADQPPFNNYTEMLRDVERPFVLYLALLLHDAGKALHTGDHSEVGGKLATRVAQRLNLDGTTTHSLRLIIENHLLMAQTSQRRDLEDSSVIRAFAAVVQTPVNLRMLTLHTFADSMGTSSGLWNGFKDTLLLTLFRKGMEVLVGGAGKTAEQRERELLEEEIARTLPKSFGDDELHAHFEHLPPRYFEIHGVREIAGDLALTHRFMHHQLTEEERALEPVMSWHNEPDRGYTVLKICTWDRVGLFSKICGSLSAAGINILSSQSFTRADGIALDTFYVTDAHGGTLVSRDQRDSFESIANKALTEQPINLHSLIARQKQARPLYQSHEGERIPTRIHIDNNSSEASTIIEVETEDRIGLLYAISQVFSELGVNIVVAKILTEKGAAIDTFYVQQVLGGKIENASQLSTMERRLVDAIAMLDAPVSAKAA